MFLKSANFILKTLPDMTFLDDIFNTKNSILLSTKIGRDQ